MTFALVFLIQSQLYSQEVRKYSNEFLSIGVNAKGLSMGGAQVASVDDVTSSYWNPAGLLSIENDFEIGLMHSEYFKTIANIDYGAFAMPLKESDVPRAIGFTIFRTGVDDIPYTLDLIEPDGSINYDNVTSFSVADYAFILSYAQEFPGIEGLGLGGSAKIIHRSAGEFANAWGFGLDAGAQYEVKNFKFGALFRDITTTFTAWSFDFNEHEKEILLQTGNEVPESSVEITTPSLVLGGSYKYTFENDISLMGEVNFNTTSDGKRNVVLKTNLVSLDPFLGVEGGYKNLVFLRGGMNRIQTATDDNGEKTTLFWPNLGVGFNFKGLAVDYAMTNVGHDALLSHVFSLKLRFSKGQSLF